MKQKSGKGTPEQKENKRKTAKPQMVLQDSLKAHCYKMMNLIKP